MIGLQVMVMIVFVGAMFGLSLLPTEPNIKMSFVQVVKVLL